MKGDGKLILEDPELRKLWLDLVNEIENGYLHRKRNNSRPDGPSAGVRCVERREATAPQGPQGASGRATGARQIHVKPEEPAA